MLRVLEHALDLRRGGAPERQRRQSIARKERHLAGFVAGTGAAAGDFANEEELVDRVDVMGRVVALLVVEDRGKLEGTRFESRFFGDFSGYSLGGGLIHVGPTARKRPFAVADFAHQQLSLVDKRSPP